MSESEHVPGGDVGQNPENETPPTRLTSSDIRDMFEQMGEPLTPSVKTKIEQLKKAEGGDVIAEANIAAEDAEFQREVTEPVSLIARYEREHLGERMSPKQLKEALSKAGYSHINEEKLRETIQAYYGEND